MQLAGHLRGRALQEWVLLEEDDRRNSTRATTALRARLDPGSKVLASTGLPTQYSGGAGKGCEFHPDTGEDLQNRIWQRLLQPGDKRSNTLRPTPGWSTTRPDAELHSVWGPNIQRAVHGRS